MFAHTKSVRGISLILNIVLVVFDFNLFCLLNWAVKVAFNNTFLNPPAQFRLVGSAELFKQYLIGALSQQSNATHERLRYTSIVQSSGWGKSRVAVEFCKQFNIPCLYLCLRKFGHSGFPERSTMATSILEKLGADTGVDKAVFARKFFRNAIYTAFTKKFMKKDQMLTWDTCDDFWTDVISRCDRNENHTDEEIAQLIATKTTECGISTSDCPINALFVFDEARELLPTSPEQKNLFLITRRAIYHLKLALSQFKVFVVYMDTHSKLANFSPSKQEDSSSARVDYHLQNPFIAVSNHPWLFAVDSTLNPQHPYDPRFFGRPLWKSTLQGGHSMSQILNFAVHKLIRSSTKKFSELSQEQKYHSSLAVICCCLGMSVVPTSEKSSTLVASHMVRALLMSWC